MSDTPHRPSRATVTPEGDSGESASILAQALAQALAGGSVLGGAVLDASGRVLGPGPGLPCPDGSGRELSPGDMAADAFPPAGRERFLELFREALSGGTGACASLRSGERDGRPLVAEVWVLPVPGADRDLPDVPAAAFLCRDVTVTHEETEKLRRGTLDVIRLNAEMRAMSASREMALNNLEELSGRLKGVLEAASRVVIVATNPKGIVTIFNPGAVNLLGYAPGEMVGVQTPLAFLDEDELAARGQALAGESGRPPAGIEAFKALARSGRRDQGQWNLVRKDGSRFPAELALSAIEGADGPDGYLLVGVDISRRKLAEEAMAEREARLRAILDGAADGILTVDTRGRIESLNRAAMEMFGSRPDELTGERLSRVAPKVTPAFLVGRAAGPREVEGRRLDGRTFPMEMAVSAVELSSRTLFTCIARDITARREAEEAARLFTRRLAAQQAAMERDLKAAAEIQKSLLPRNLTPDPRYEARWLFDPSAAIGGDIFNILELGDGLIAVYMLDVSGHGAPSALVAASAAQALQQHSREGAGRGPDGPDPSRVLDALDMEFPLDRFDRYFSLAYLTLDLKRNLLRYSNAGHPPPLLVRAGGDVEELWAGGPVIGLGGLLPFEQDSLVLAPGDLLVLYTDGLTEFEDASGTQYGIERLKRLLAGSGGQGAGQVLKALGRDIKTFSDGLRPQDDLSVLVLSCSSTGKIVTKKT